MEALRELIALLLFICSTVLLIVLFNNTFDWIQLVIIFSGFLLAYFIWPSKRKNQRKRENALLDILEIIVELPIELLFWPFRVLWRVIRRSDNILDI